MRQRMNNDRSCTLRTWLLLAAVSTRPGWAGEPGESRQLALQERVLRDGLNPEGCLWQCRLIAPEGKPVPTKVVAGPAGRYRELSGPSFGHFGYRFRVQRLYMPHLAVVEWPDDANRRFQVEIMEGTSFRKGGMWAVQNYGFTPMVATSSSA